MTQGINEQIGTLSAIEAERHFFEIGLQMLGAQFVPRSTKPALEKRESGFDGVGVSVPAHIFLGTVLDNFVLRLESHPFCNSAIDAEFIGAKHIHILPNILAEEFFERAARHVLGMKQTEFAIALTDADNWTLLGSSPAPSSANSASADIGFIHFDLATEHWLIHFGHCCADSVAEIPCRLVADSERALNLTGGHSFLRFTEQQRCYEPFCERQVGVIENRSSRYGELVVAILAVENLSLGFEFDGLGLAARALRASGPAQAAKQFAALFICGEHRVYIN